jgi:hypothetical protein
MARWARTRRQRVSRIDVELRKERPPGGGLSKPLFLQESQQVGVVLPAPPRRQMLWPSSLRRSKSLRFAEADLVVDERDTDEAS